jgi:uncharacterized protein YcaQ
MESLKDYLKKRAQEYRQLSWKLDYWSPSAALLPKDKNHPSWKYYGQSVNPDEYEIVKDGWSHDHCPFCDMIINDVEYEGAITEAYTDGYNWICPDCHKRIVLGSEDP